MGGFRPRRVLVPVVVLAAVLTGACGSSTSVTPTAGAASDPAATATPSGRAVVDAFLRKFASQDVPFHVTFNATVEVEGQRIPFAGDVDAVGSDAAGTVTVPVQGQMTTVEMVLFKGNAYGRVPGGKWGRLEVQQTQPINPFSRLRQGDDLRYSGMTERSGRQLHRLRTTKWIGEDPSKLSGSGLQRATIKNSTFDIFAESDGTPVEALLVFTMTGTSGGKAVELRGDVTYRFSNVGETVTITPPPVP